MSNDQKLAAFWDDPSLKPAANSWVKFKEPGDKAGPGTVKSLGKKVFNAGQSNESVAVEVEFEEDDLPNLTAGQWRLKKALFDLRVLPADVLEVEYLGDSNGSKCFRTTVKRAVGPDGVVDDSAELDPVW